MKKNKLLITIGAVVLVVLIFSVLLLDKSNNNTVMIGVTGPQVGLYADIGQSMMNGAFLACDEFNSRGELKFSIDAQNDSGEPKNAMTCINKMLARGVDGLIIMGDNQVPALAEKVRAARIPVIATIVATSDFLGKKDNMEVTVFRNYSNVEYAAERIAEYASKVLVGKSGVVLYTQNAYGMSGARSFVKWFKEFGGDVLLDEAFDENANDLRGIVSKCLGKNPDVVYVVGFGTGYNRLINQIHELGYRGKILTDEPISGPSCVGVIKDFSNIYFTNNPIPDSDRYNEFCSKYEKMFGALPNVFSIYGYDSMNILCEAIAKSREMNSTPSKYIISKKKFPTLLGGIEFKNTGDCIIPVGINKMNSDGKYERVQ